MSAENNHQSPINPAKTITLGLDGRVWEFSRKPVDFLDFRPNSTEITHRLEEYVERNFNPSYFQSVVQFVDHLGAVEVILENWKTFTRFLNPSADNGNITSFSFPEVKFTSSHTREHKVIVDLIGIDSCGHVYLVEVGANPKRKREQMKRELKAFRYHFPQAAVSGVVAEYGDVNQGKLVLNLEVRRS